MVSMLRYAALAILLVGAFGCGTQREAEIQAARACGIDGLYATIDEATTLSFSLPEAVAVSRPRVVAKYLKAQRTSVALPEGFDPFSAKEIAVISSGVEGQTDLSVRFVLDPELSDELHDAVLATPGKVRLTIDFAATSGDGVCTIDVGLLPPSL